MTAADIDGVRRQAEAEASERFSLMLSGEASEDSLLEIEMWRAADAANDAAWERMAAIWNGSAAIAANPAIDAMREAALARSPSRRPRWQDWRPLALAASLVLVVGGALWLGSGGDMPWTGPDGGAQIAGAGGAQWSPETRTRIGQIRPVELGDGTVVTINTDSALRTAISGTERRVALSRGEAYFQVARDVRRPFSVESGGVTVTALGTAFAVRNTGDAVLVTLIEGRVSVASAETGEDLVLTPGSQLRANAAGFKVQKVDAARAVGWTHGTLDFNQAPLAAVVEEMNRYASRPVVLTDPGLAGQPITGVFRTGEQDRFVDMLVATGKVRVSRRTGSAIELGAP